MFNHFDNSDTRVLHSIWQNDNSVSFIMNCNVVNIRQQFQFSQFFSIRQFMPDFHFIFIYSFSYRLGAFKYSRLIWTHSPQFSIQGLHPHIQFIRHQSVMFPQHRQVS